MWTTGSSMGFGDLGDKEARRERKELCPPAYFADSIGGGKWTVKGRSHYYGKFIWFGFSCLATNRKPQPAEAEKRYLDDVRMVVKREKRRRSGVVGPRFTRFIFSTTDWTTMMGSSNGSPLLTLSAVGQNRNGKHTHVRLTRRLHLSGCMSCGICDAINCGMQN